MGETHRYVERINLGDTIGGIAFGHSGHTKDNAIAECEDKLEQENALRRKEAFEANEARLCAYLDARVPAGKKYIYLRDPNDGELKALQRIGGYRTVKETMKYKHLHGSYRVETESVEVGYNGSIDSSGNINVSPSYNDVKVLYCDVDSYSDETFDKTTFYYFVDQSRPLDDFVSRFNFIQQFDEAYEQFKKTGNKHVGSFGKRGTIFNTISLLFTLAVVILTGIQCTREIILPVGGLVGFGLGIYLSFIAVFIFKMLFFKNLKGVKEVRPDIASHNNRFYVISIIQLVLLTLSVITLIFTYPHYYDEPKTLSSIFELFYPENLLPNIPFVLAVILANVSIILEIVNLIMWVKTGANQLVNETLDHDYMIDTFVSRGGVRYFDQCLFDLQMMVR